MTSWEIKGIPDTGEPDFKLTLDINGRTWTVDATGNEVFKTKSGGFVFTAGRAKEAVLQKSSGEVVANLRNLHSNSKVGDKGQGHQQETAIPFKWNLESK